MESDEATLLELLGSASSKLKLPLERFWRTKSEINQIKSEKKDEGDVTYAAFPGGCRAVVGDGCQLAWGSYVCRSF